MKKKRKKPDFAQFSQTIAHRSLAKVRQIPLGAARKSYPTKLMKSA